MPVPPAINTKRCSGGSTGNTKLPSGPSTSTSAPGASERCDPAEPFASTPMRSSTQSSRTASSGAAAIGVRLACRRAMRRDAHSLARDVVKRLPAQIDSHDSRSWRRTNHFTDRPCQHRGIMLSHGLVASRARQPFAAGAESRAVGDRRGRVRRTGGLDRVRELRGYWPPPGGPTGWRSFSGRPGSHCYGPR